MSQDLQAKMRRLFAKYPFIPTVTKPEPPPPAKAPSTRPSQPSLQPKYVVPPLPHPCPHEHLLILSTPEGLLLRPSLPKHEKPCSYVRIDWGKEGKISEVQDEGECEHLGWNESYVVYGIVGILNLFSASYLLVISARSHVGHLFAETHPIYGVKGVTVVPLLYTQATAALKALASQRTPKPRPSLLPLSFTADDSQFSPGGSGPSGTSSPRVKFAEEDEVKLMTPRTTEGFNDLPDPDSGNELYPSSTSSSGRSSPSSEYSLNTGNVAKVLADRLSFWNRLSKRALKPQLLSPELTLAQEEEALDSLMNEDSPTQPISIDSAREEGTHDPTQLLNSILSKSAPAPPTTEEKHNELEEKIIRGCVKEFTRGGMYFAYSFDITRSLQNKQELIINAKKEQARQRVKDDSNMFSPIGEKAYVLAEPSATLPLWRRVDRQYWWNEWLSKPFIDAGLHPYVLPIMQGYYQISSFDVPREPVASEEGDFAPVDYIVISRRSRDRAGLRYQRRGIDDDAHVANFVETETIMRVEREGFVNVFSHIQIRGSIPLFWNQQGAGLKPAPTLSPDRTHKQNSDVIKRHLTNSINHYGPLTIINLAEQTGKEGLVTNAYREYVDEINMGNVRYVEYDFHRETRGMKYENISKLIDKMERTFETQGYLWISDDALMSQQKGVFRINCIDCLDRTNVVESAFARYVLSRQLGAVALLSHNDSVEKTETDIVFNDVWANNGDAISRAYAGTSALKGDFTRTGKRDISGLLNDGVNSLARMYTSTFGDWFNQAVIDFMLGSRTISVFHEFLLKLQSSDPSELIRISRIRAEAVATSVARVLEDGERLLSGWTLFAPEQLNVKVGSHFEEKVLLLSVRALYIISYDYTLEKVKMYTRVPLGDVIAVTQGAYILSPLEEASRDPLQNYGFTISWHHSHQATRVTSYSVRNSLDLLSPLSSPVIPHSPTPGASAARKGTCSLVAPSSPRVSHPPPRKSTPLARLLSNAAVPVDVNTGISFAAFKALPIDPARSHRESGDLVEPADELSVATNCKEAVRHIVDAIRRACSDVGNGRDGFVTDGDVVSLAEAQRMTSMYSKMEYGVKRLLWLGS